MKNRGYPFLAKGARQSRGGLLVLILGLAFPLSCERSSGEAGIVPPPTDPLKGGAIGYGVVNASYTHVVDAPDPKGASLGYLRKGAVVKIIERRSVRNQGPVYTSWVYAEGSARGWLPERVVDIYDNESMAITASRSMGS
jgi:hypothetical protein